MKLISDGLKDAICEQISHEKYNANLYMFLSGFLKNKGFNNLGNMFLSQHDEETTHSKMIFDILTDLNTPIVIPEIDRIDFPISSIIEIADKYLEREYLTTRSLDEIKELAIDEDCPVVEEFMRQMINLQRQEYAEATDFQDKANLTSGDWWKVMLWDLALKD